LTGQTSGLAPGYAQANLVILPQSLAEEFHEFCLRNPKPCPLLEVTAPGDSIPEKTARNADLQTDLPRYRVWRNGQLVAEPADIRDLWQNDFVSFLIGCSFSFRRPCARDSCSPPQLGPCRCSAPQSPASPRSIPGSAGGVDASIFARRCRPRAKSPRLSSDARRTGPSRKSEQIGVADLSS
jgi:hypothetical protein